MLSPMTRSHRRPRPNPSHAPRALGLRLARLHPLITSHPDVAALIDELANDRRPRSQWRLNVDGTVLRVCTALNDAATSLRVSGLSPHAILAAERSAAWLAFELSYLHTPRGEWSATRRAGRAARIRRVHGVLRRIVMPESTALQRLPIVERWEDEWDDVSGHTAGRLLRPLEWLRFQVHPHPRCSMRAFARYEELKHRCRDFYAYYAERALHDTATFSSLPEFVPGLDDVPAPTWRRASSTDAWPLPWRPVLVSLTRAVLTAAPPTVAPVPVGEGSCARFTLAA